MSNDEIQPQLHTEADVLDAVADLLHDPTPERLVKKLMELRGLAHKSDLYFAAKMYPASLNRFITGKNKGRMATTIEPLAQALNVPVSLFDAWKDESAPDRGKQGGRGNENSHQAINPVAAYAEVGVTAPAFTL